MSTPRGDQFAGLWRIARFIARRDRIRLGIWVVGYLAVVVISAWSLAELYADSEAIIGYATLFSGNPALTVFAGPGHGLDIGVEAPTLGAILVNEIQLWGGITLGLMSIFLVVRSTRAEEEAERAELLASAVVGRHAVAAAAVILVAGAQVVIAAASAVGFIAFGFAPVGSVALAASITAVGWVFLAIGLLSAQVFSTARGALAGALLVLVAAFIARAVGDVADHPVRWLSPIGWSQAVRAFVDERWWVLGLSVAGTVVVLAAAVWATMRRDLGAGLIGARPGRAQAGMIASHPMLRVARLQRGSIFGWSVGLILIGAVFGSIADEIEKMLIDQPQLAEFFAQAEGITILDAYLSTAAIFIGLLAAGFAVASALAVHHEERHGRAELLWAGPLSRARWLGHHLAVTGLAAAWMLVAGGLGLGVAAVVSTGDAGLLGVSVRAAVAMAPAVAVMLALTVVTWALRPAWSLGIWAYVAVVVLIGYFAELLRLPTAVRSLSPFEHLALLPAEPWRTTPAVVMSAVVVGVLALAVVGVGRRDLRAG